MIRILYKIVAKLVGIYDEQKMLAVKRQLKYCGEKVIINQHTTIVSPEELEIGENTLIADYTTIFAKYGVKIGRDCLISVGCCISSLNHEIVSIKRPGGEYEKSYPVTLGNNVWLGMNVCVLPGVEIGNNSIVGAGSVVTKSIPANEIWVGNPAKFIKKIDFE